VRVLILGAGFGGLELATRLSHELGDRVDVTLIDQAEGFIFGFSKLDVMFGRVPPESVFHPYADLVKPGVRFERTTVRSIDPHTRTVVTDAGDFDADILVVALGADLHPDATPGLLEGGNEFYTVAGAFALRDVLAEFDGGRVIVGVTSTRPTAGSARQSATGETGWATPAPPITGGASRFSARLSWSRG